MLLTNTLALAFTALFSVVDASPVDKRAVFVPLILYPKAGIVWRVGETHSVTWSTANAPANISNAAYVFLGQNGRVLSSGPGSYAQPLASGFDLRSGRTTVQVPNVTANRNYQILLFGDSTNFGESFTITK